VPARARGANAVIAMRFDCSEIGDIMSEVAGPRIAGPASPEDAIRGPAARYSEI